MQIKINRAKKLTKWGNNNGTFTAAIKAIPADIINALTSKQLASLIDANQEIFNAGKSANQQEINSYLGYDFWDKKSKLNGIKN